MPLPLKLLIMSAENDELDVTHQTGASDSQPGNISQPDITHPAEAGRSTSQPGENLAQTLSEINVNISTMACLLKTIVERQNTEPQKKRRHSQHESLSADSESEDIEYETASKRRREDDELSLSPSDGDIADLLEGSNSTERSKRHLKRLSPKKNSSFSNLSKLTSLMMIMLAPK